MTRLYVLGCSFSNYAWPTWADMLGLEFDEYENWAFPGLGNRAIAERVAEIHAKNKLTKDDTVIIQWTSHLRHDWHATDARHQDNAGWKTSGSLFNYINQEIFDEKWIKTFWSETSYIMHTFNNILLTQEFLNGIGCNWRMTSMGYINKMNSDYPDGEHGEQTSDINIWESQPNLQVYKKIFDDETKWIKPVGTFAWNHESKPYKFKSMQDKSVFAIDRHPTIQQHKDYLDKHVLPSLGISQKQTKKTNYWIDTINKLYETCHKDFDLFCANIEDKISNRNNYYRGF
tara:strand:- start:696 stop:1556 length:861 start_codon:yes stop_codon:yes gene_type:complete